jgi:8-oxo-dGTP pyrophosphatase MutT (NUDIX family)
MIRVEPITSLDLRLSAEPWRFAAENGPAIGTHWDKVLAAKPTLWNGRTLLCRKARIECGQFTAEFVETDYASFVAWRDWGRPDASVINCFGVPAVFSSDGALLIGVMGHWTLNGGRAYPPSGTLEPRDVRPDGTVDVLGNMKSELLEETGLDLAEAQPGTMAAIFEGPRLAIVQRHDFPLSFAEIEQRFTAHKAVDQHPELERIEPVWKGGSADHRMPDFVAEIIRHFHV